MRRLSASWGAVFSCHTTERQDMTQNPQLLEVGSCASACLLPVFVLG